MSSCNFQQRIKGRASRALVAGVGMALAVALTGCAGGDGFRPMYAASASGPQLQEKMAAVDVGTIPSRVGQRVRNELIFQATGGGGATPPIYRLDVAIKESIAATLVKVTGEAASNVYVLDATFTLVDIRSKKVLLRGNSHARAGFDRFPSIYSNVRAREDAENRAANVIAEDLKSRLAAFLSNDKV
jgi:LPS-assembly lipoprotein